MSRGGLFMGSIAKNRGGLVHIMLPNSKAARSGQLHNPAKYADTGIQILRAELIKKWGGQRLSISR